jgi:hypothetical protein
MGKGTFPATYVPMYCKVWKSLCLPGTRLVSTTTPSYLEEKGKQWVAVVVGAMMIRSPPSWTL